MKKHLGSLAALVIERGERLRSLLMSHGVGKVYQVKGKDAALPGPRFECDVVLIELGPDTGSDTLYRARIGGRLAWSIPVIAIHADGEEPQWLAMREAGVSDVLTRSSTDCGILSSIEAALARVPTFVRTETYCGPDRRHAGHHAIFGPRTWGQGDWAFLGARPLGLRLLKRGSNNVQ